MIPDYQTLMLPILKLTAQGELTNRACVETIAEQFALSPEEKEQLLPSGKQTIIANRVHWAATYMTKAGLIDRPKRGMLTATERGRAILSQQNPPRIDNKFLAQFEGFQEFQARAKDKGKTQALQQLEASHVSEAVATPEEQIELAAQAMHSALRDELLTRIINADPTFFEKVILDLMLAMGYESMEMLGISDEVR